MIVRSSAFCALILLGTSTAVAASREPEMSRADVIATTLPAVVQVLVNPSSGVDQPGTGSADDSDGRQDEAAAGALGSGFIIAADGLVVTNAHVLVHQAGRAGGPSIEVKLADGSLRPATVVGVDAATDIALLKLPTGRYSALRWGESDSLRVGDDVIAVGSPFGLGGTVTAGIVSGRSRVLGAGPYDDFLQIDAAINHGNSGGPLLDRAGRVVGVNAAIVSPSGGSIGLGFSIPSALARKVAAALLAKGRIEHGALGVQVQSVDADIGAALGLPDARGALVTSVVADGPAARAGVLPGDVVLGVNRRDIPDIAGLSAQVAALSAGGKVTLNLWRGARKQAVELTAAGPSSADDRLRALQDASNRPTAAHFAGLTLVPADPTLSGLAGQSSDATGLIVTTTEPGGAAVMRGVAAGDLVTGVNGVPVSDVANLIRAQQMAKQAGRQLVLLTIERGGARAFIPVPID